MLWKLFWLLKRRNVRKSLAVQYRTNNSLYRCNNGCKVQGYYRSGVDVDASTISSCPPFLCFTNFLFYSLRFFEWPYGRRCMYLLFEIKRKIKQISAIRKNSREPSTSGGNTLDGVVRVLHGVCTILAHRPMVWKHDAINKPEVLNISQRRQSQRRTEPWSQTTCVKCDEVPHRYGNSRAIWDHTVLPATWQRWHSRLYPSQLRLVLDLATPEGCKAELT